MKTLYHGGQKSGKSHLAEQKALILAGNAKPIYIATYDNSYGDAEMDERIGKHQAQRQERFVTISTIVSLKVRNFQTPSNLRLHFATTLYA